MHEEPDYLKKRSVAQVITYLSIAILGSYNIGIGYNLSLSASHFIRSSKEIEGRERDSLRITFASLC